MNSLVKKIKLKWSFTCSSQIFKATSGIGANISQPGSLLQPAVLGIEPWPSEMFANALTARPWRRSMAEPWYRWLLVVGCMLTYTTLTRLKPSFGWCLEIHINMCSLHCPHHSMTFNYSICKI